MSKMIMYRIFKPILGPIYKLYYKPVIIGKENIPKKGNFVIVGNHVHIMDQCNVIIKSKQPIHYMSKKEYFDGPFKWFFKSVGCIPVDRSRKDEDAVSSALDVLNNGEVLGLFPEGTRNKVKEEYAKELHEKYIGDNGLDFKNFYEMVKNNKTSQVMYLEELLKDGVITEQSLVDSLSNTELYLGNLMKRGIISEDDFFDREFLPFKYGAVSMAHKTNSPIVPFVICGEYKPVLDKDKLTVYIGKPMEVSDDLEEANKVLRKTMIDMYKEHYKNKVK